MTALVPVQLRQAPALLLASVALGIVARESGGDAAIQTMEGAECQKYKPDAGWGWVAPALKDYAC